MREEKYDLVLDIACGSGAVSAYLAERFPAVEFVGLDFSQELIKIAKRQVLANLRFYNFDLLNLEDGWVESLRLGEKKVLLLVLGAMEYYDETSQFAKKILCLWQKIKHGALICVFLNQELWCRKIYRGQGKKYWRLDQALSFFGPGLELAYKYYSFFIYDPIITKFSWLDKLFLSCDKKFSNCRELTTSFEILLRK